MLRKAPPLDATEAFLVAARVKSFRAAAAALALSPSAFSRRIQLLEAFVGVPLFDRSGATIQLTNFGTRYLKEIEPAMETIRRATGELRQSNHAGKLRIATSHSLAVSWLMPRLSNLFQRHGLAIELNITRSVHVLRSGEADLAIWGGSSLADDLPSDKMIDLEGVVVSAPILVNGIAPPRSMDELARHPMVSVKTSPDLWRRWLAKTDCKGAEPSFIASFDTSHLMYEASASGLGLALAVPLLTERFMRDMRLSPCLGVRASVDSNYSVYYASAAQQRRAPARLFADWFRDEVDKSRQAFHVWGDPIAATKCGPTEPCAG